MDNLGVLNDPRLRVLHIEDERKQSDSLSRFSTHLWDWTSIAFENGDKATTYLRELAFTKGSVDIIISDQCHIGMSGIDVLSWLRNLSDDYLMAGGLRIRHTPLLFASGSLYKSETLRRINSIDPRIRIIDKPYDIRNILLAVEGTIREYRDAVLSDLEYLGVGVISLGGQFHILKTFRLRGKRMLESKYFAGPVSQAKNAASRVMLISDRWQAASAAVEELEYLLNQRRTSERQFQAFFCEHPEFLFGDEQGFLWSEPILPTEEEASFKPDFVIKTMRSTPDEIHWSLVDLKRPSESLVTHHRYHPDFSANVYHAANQLRDYSDRFMDPRYQTAMRDRFGEPLERPKLATIIGRTPGGRSRRVETLQERMTDVKVISYDDILEFRRSRLKQIMSSHEIRI